MHKAQTEKKRKHTCAFFVGTDFIAQIPTRVAHELQGSLKRLGKEAGPDLPLQLYDL
jgi:hypothetical protein